MHIPDDPLYYEKFYFTPGDLGFPVFDTRYARIGIQICWDQWYPEGARLVSLQGAQVICYPTSIGWHPVRRRSSARRNSTLGAPFSVGTPSPTGSTSRWQIASDLRARRAGSSSGEIPSSPPVRRNPGRGFQHSRRDPDRGVRSRALRGHRAATGRFCATAALMLTSRSFSAGSANESSTTQTFRSQSSVARACSERNALRPGLSYARGMGPSRSHLARLAA